MKQLAPFDTVKEETNNTRRVSLKELWVPLSGAKAQQRRVETIANNVANANTTAFKKDQAVFKEHLTAYEKGTDIDLPNKEWAPEDFYRSYGAEKAHVKVDGTYTKFTQGQISPTNNPFDIALEGKGFIEVLSPNGIRYTRKGNLYLNNEGELVTDGGNRVLSSLVIPEGTPEERQAALENAPDPKDRVIRVSNQPLNINQKGELHQQGNLVGKISIVEFKDLTALQKEGNSVFVNKSVDNRADKSSTLVHQGSLELSNVNPIQEMSKLIQAHRQLESIQRVIKTYDNMAGKAYNEIAKF
ncbi:MAG: flagellar basal-body rod protein FlgF [Halobacteriovoraceae bacterium]|nr:flagellar basal-body rod protein FlgF [Halobacteriovoraceae bacterium]